MPTPTFTASTAPTCIPLQRRYPARPASISRMRHSIAEAATEGALGPISPEQTDALLLIASELATNAVAHACQQDNTDELFEVTLWTADQHLWVAVADSSLEPPAQREPDAGSSNGRGLLLVSLLAATWGNAPRAGGFGKVVFAGLQL
jgi:two-component sensor histidine kinase